MPDISIIIRTKNEESWIAHCLAMLYKQDYPDFEDWVIENYGGLLKVDTDNQSYAESSKQLSMMIKYSEDEHDQKIYNKWVDFVGGSSNAFMKEFLINFSLA